MSKSLKRIAITGAAGHISYSLLFRIASGEMLGANQQIALHLLEIPQAMDALKGLLLELDDSRASLPLLKEVKIGAAPLDIFKGVDYVILIGAKARTAGMERSELLKVNAKNFREHGMALNAVASSEVVVLVVGNPCNTNCLIAQHYARRINPMRFFAMSQLDQNRFAAQLAKRADVPLKDVSRVTIWGNHSSTQVPDYVNVRIRGKSALEVIGDEEWFQKSLIPEVQKRGELVIRARGESSAASAANAIIQCMHHLVFPTKEGETFSCALLSDGNPYGIAPGIVFSFPCLSKGHGEVSVVPGFTWDPFIRKLIEVTEQELLDERAQVEEFLQW